MAKLGTHWRVHRESPSSSSATVRLSLLKQTIHAMRESRFPPSALRTDLIPGHIDLKQVIAWVYGHTHYNSRTFKRECSRIRGYASSLSLIFNVQKVINNCWDWFSTRLSFSSYAVRHLTLIEFSEPPQSILVDVPATLPNPA